VRRFDSSRGHCPVRAGSRMAAPLSSCLPARWHPTDTLVHGASRVARACFRAEKGSHEGGFRRPRWRRSRSVKLPRRRASGGSLEVSPFVQVRWLPARWLDRHGRIREGRPNRGRAVGGAASDNAQEGTRHLRLPRVPASLARAARALAVASHRRQASRGCHVLPAVRSARVRARRGKPGPVGPPTPSGLSNPQRPTSPSASPQHSPDRALWGGELLASEGVRAITRKGDLPRRLTIEGRA
jgi:hypothetical protein